MRSSPTVALVLALAVAGGCATRQPISVEELRPHMQRFLPGVTPEQVISATQELFLLADPNDVSFTPTVDGVEVRRKYWSSLLIGGERGQFIWNVTMQERGDGTLVHLAIRHLHTAVSFMVLTDTREFVVSDAGSFDAYFDRLSFLLGISTDWRTCKQLFGMLEVRPHVLHYPMPLCRSADDNPPPRVRHVKN